METLDILGIGVGPFNLGLAALAAPLTQLRCAFVDSRPGFSWHQGMMLDDAHLQVPFMADLVTMADPTSEYSFLNYLKHVGRLYPFYIREDFYPLRQEYNAYCQWVARRLPSVQFNSEVTQVTPDGDAYLVEIAHQGGQAQVRAKNLVLGTGTTPWMPEPARAFLEEPEHQHLPVLHSADYLRRKKDLIGLESITVVGSGQSAAEIYFDLLNEQEEHGYQLNWVTRSGRFFPLEYTKLTLEMTSPEYIDHFHALSSSRREELGREQKTLYKGIDSALINAIYDLLYQRSVAGKTVNTRLLTNAQLVEVRRAEQVELDFVHSEADEKYTLGTQGVVLATGYRATLPPFSSGLAERIKLDENGAWAVDRSYAITEGPRNIFVQNAELHTHGFSAPDLGMGAYRNSVILNQILGMDYYQVEDRIAFQEFGVPSDLKVQQSEAVLSNAN